MHNIGADQKEALELEIKHALWRACAAVKPGATLEWKLDPTQIRVRRARESVWAPPPPLPPGTVLTEIEKVRRAAVPISFFEFLARGNGKSFELTCLAVEKALCRPNQRILYCAPLREDAEKIVKDLLELHILIDCPDDVKPEWKAGDGEYHFANGSIIRFRGVNNESAERLRGAGYHLVILDEVGSYDQLPDVLAIVRPIAKRLKGKIVLATTPAVQKDHPSNKEYERHATKLPWRPPNAIKLTMLDNPRWTWEERVQILVDCGEEIADIPKILAGEMLPKTTEALREYWCMPVTDDAVARFPTWRQNAKRLIRTGDERPEFFFPYTTLDLGYVDRTGGVYGYHDYENDLIVAEDESLLVRPNSREIADEVFSREFGLWGNKPPHPVTRIMDAQPFILESLRAEHHLDFQPPNKSQIQHKVSFVQGANNYANLLISGGQVRIHERCVNLIRQLENAIWNKQKNDFDRDESGDADSMGHFDLAAAFLYFCLAVDRRKNPFPVGYRLKRDGPDVWRKPVAQGTGLLPNTPLFRRLVEKQRRAGRFGR